MDQNSLDIIISNLKARVKTEMKRRDGIGSVSSFAGSEWDYTTPPKLNKPLLTEHLKKIVDPLLQIKDFGDPEFVKESSDFTNLKEAQKFLDKVEKEGMHGDYSSCRSSCTGLCVGNCMDLCMGCLGCTGCTGCSGCGSTCSGTCLGNCNDECYTKCDSQCMNNCDSLCITGCSKGCYTSCNASCGNGCSTTCGSSSS